VKEELVDAYDSVRSIRLLSVLNLLGLQSDFKTRKGGTESYGACPICKPKRNRTAFSFDDTGRFHCFACNTKGKGAIDLVKAIKGCGFQEAVDWLKGISAAAAAVEPRIKLVQSPPPEPLPTENPPFKSTYEKFAVESPWLKERGLLPETLARYEVFQYHNPARRSVYSGSVMLKIRRYRDGECVGYVSRNIGEVTPERPKYLFPKGVQKALELFGAWQIKNEAPSLPLRVGYLVESPFCVLKFHQHGLPAVAPFGWSVSPQQAELLCSLAKGWIYLPDADKRADALHIAGELAQQFWVKMPSLPDGVADPEKLSAEQIRALS
jgi:DNA primase